MGLIIILLVILAFFTPCLFIWALNTLFALHIAYGVAQYFAALILILVISGSGIKFTSSK